MTTSIDHLRISNLRNLNGIEMIPSPGINVIYGLNGSGKTSLLEGIHLLGLSRSFRSRLAAPVIQSGEKQLTVFGRISYQGSAYDLGISKSRDGENQARINGAAAGSLAEIAKLLPIVSIIPQAFDLLTGGPGERRQFVDWGVFHVEPNFIDVWRNYQKCLKQRNHLLRRGKIADSEIAIWDQQLANFGLQIDEARRRYLESLFPSVLETLRNFLGEETSATQHYQSGWPKGKSLLDSLKESRDRDQLQGRTGCGPHRAEIEFRVNGLDAGEHLSRGQQKIVICALKLAQGEDLFHRYGKKCIYLVDDLHAELDDQNASTLCRLLDESNTQVFITSLERDSIQYRWNPEQPMRMFHVEQGRVCETAMSCWGANNQ